MLEDMYKVLNRINEIQRRFTPNKNNPLNFRNNEPAKKFNETLNEQIENNKLKEIPKDAKTEIPFSKIQEIKKGTSGLMRLMPGALKDEISSALDIEDNIHTGVNILKEFGNVLDKNGKTPPVKDTGGDVKKLIDAYIQNIK